LQPDVADISKVSPQGRIGGLVSPQNGRAELRARLPEKTEWPFRVAAPAKPVDSRGNGEYAQPVGILQRYGEAQDRKMPRPYRPGVPFIWSVAQIHAGHD
jgi:hypothetical protein